MRLTIVTLASFTIFLLAQVSFAARPSVRYDRGTGQVVLTNGRLELLIETRRGINPRRMRDLKTGRLFADADYTWPGGELPKMVGAPQIDNRPDGNPSLTLRGRLGDIAIEQSFIASADEPGAILERLTLSNPTDKTLATGDFKCGFAKRVRNSEAWLDDATALRLSPIPYRRETNGKLMESPLREVAEHGMSYAGWAEKPIETPTWGAEGWVWSDRTSTLVIAKYNPDGMEWSLMEPVVRGKEVVMRFAGAGQWKHSLPEGATRLDPGQSFRFGETLLHAVDGGWQQGYYAFRRYTESKGDRPHDGYNPPVHWNELYDNQYFTKIANEPLDQDFRGKEKKFLKEYYTLELMKSEAAKASELGCEALYLDPGWDTGASYHVWDAERLGTMDSFVKMAREEFGLKVSLWISLGGAPPTYGHPDACPIEARVIDKNGNRTGLQCYPSPSFLATKTERLLELCRHGAAFLMFDSTQYTGPCYDKTHGHAIPSTREEHAQALLELTRQVKSQYPQVLIEMHDPISGPSGIHYAPTDYGYGRPHSFDCLWGHEFMWNSMRDLVQGKALSLYYYNLAYSIPLYLHVGLKTDNANALMFWWYASTIRHLGVGGKSADSSVWDAQKNAMRTYLPLKRFYTQGAFYGLEETLHAHTLPDLRESVVNCFNLESRPVEKQIRFRLSDIGLPSGKVQIEGAPFTVNGDEISMDVSVPAKGHKLVKVRSATPR